MSAITKNKPFILSGILSGFVFALFMSGFDYFNDQPFLFIKFVMNFVFFGLFNGYMVYRKNKKDQNKI